MKTMESKRVKKTQKIRSKKKEQGQHHEKTEKTRSKRNVDNVIVEGRARRVQSTRSQMPMLRSEPLHAKEWVPGVKERNKVDGTTQSRMVTNSGRCKLWLIGRNKAR